MNRRSFCDFGHRDTEFLSFLQERKHTLVPFYLISDSMVFTLFLVDNAKSFTWPSAAIGFLHILQQRFRNATILPRSRFATFVSSQFCSFLFFLSVFTSSWFVCLAVFRVYEYPCGGWFAWMTMRGTGEGRVEWGVRELYGRAKFHANLSRFQRTSVPSGIFFFFFFFFSTSPCLFH